MSGKQDIHLCFILPSSGLGGAEAQLEQYLKYRPGSISVTVIYFNNYYDNLPDNMASRFRNLGVRVDHFDMPKASLLKVLTLAKVLRRLRPDLVHTLLAGSSGTWGRLAAWLARVPAIVHSDLSLNPGVTRVHRMLRPFLDRITSRFLPNALTIAEWLTSLGVPPDRIQVIQNGIDIDCFDPQHVRSARPGWDIPKEATVAGFLGKFRAEKRLDLLLDAVTTVPESGRPDFVVLGGDGPLMPMVQEKVHSHPWLRERCRLVGLVTDVPAFMAGIDYLVLCSDREGLPNVVLEAMVMERPVVGTAVADVPRLIEGTGFLVEPGQVSSLAKQLEAIQNLSRDDRTRLGIRARERVLGRHDIRGVAYRFWQAHMEVVR